jgi:hypothetical protein
MSRWFRHYAGMMRDDKLVRVAIRSKQTIERVAWVWGAILESAAEIDDEGRFDFDEEEAAYFLRADADDIGAITKALEGAGRISADCVVKWSDRQFSSDRSAERQKRYRDRKRVEVTEGDGDAEVTSPSRHGDAPETETELETEEDTPIIPLAGGRRGKTLIPTDWVAPSVSELPPRSRACAEQWTDASYQTEAEAFLLYWRGERKMKSNWRDTWANRVIAQHSAVMRNQKYGNAPTDTKRALTPAEEVESLKRMIPTYEAGGHSDYADQARARISELEGANPAMVGNVVRLAGGIGR